MIESARLAGGHPGLVLRMSVLPYLVVALAWWILLMIALSVPLFEPVTSWVMSQGLLVEKALGSAGGFWSSRLLLLTIYLLAGLGAWAVVERTGRDRVHVWRRAVFAWLGIQLIYAAAAAALVEAGILYE